MKNSQALFDNLRWYFQGVQEIENEYAEKMKYADRFKGSRGGRELSDKAARERSDALRAEGERLSKRTREITADMRERARSRTLTAPTPEQAAIVASLRSRKTLMLEEIKMAENSLNGCPLALYELDEIAQSHGFAKQKRRSGPMSTPDALAHIDTLEKCIERTIHEETGRFRRMPKDVGNFLTKWGAFTYDIATDEWGNQSVCVDQKIINAFCEAVD